MMAQNENIADRKYAFLSAATSDREIALEITSYVERKSMRVWYADRDIRPATDFQEEIDQALKNATVLITLITPNFVESQSFISEASAARALDIPIVPVIAEDVDFSLLPSWIREISVVQFPEEIEKLFDALIIYLGESARSTDRLPVEGITTPEPSIGSPNLEVDDRIDEDGDTDETYTFGAQLKDIRNEFDLSISQLAEIVDYSESYIRSLERGTRKPVASTKEKIYQGLRDNTGIPLDRLQDIYDQWGLDETPIPRPDDPSQVTATSDDKTPFHKDTPSSVDYLGRIGFVEALATWINQNRIEYGNEERSFIVNIHGQWGAGKTTFMNLLQDELQNGEKKNGIKNDWIVVWFNAWENRHLKPEWWPLLDKIYRDSMEQMRAKGKNTEKIQLQEWWWRFYSGRKVELLGFLVSLSFLGFLLFWVLRTGFMPEAHFMAKIGDVAKAFGLMFSAISTVYLGTRFIAQAVSFGSAKGAEIFLSFTSDPIEKIKVHFDHLVEKEINRPIIVFIDDLDRCDREYLVGLLENVQTILNHRKVFYVVAADQRWLFAAFEETYKEFKESIKEPGKKIGYLFLEKIFQLSMSIPKVSDEARKAYLDILLRKEKDKDRDRPAKSYEEIEKEYDEKDIKDDHGLASFIETDDEIEKIQRRNVAVAKSATLAITKSTEHFLSDFAHLMEPNPRAMKRLVTYYGVLRAIALLCNETMILDLSKRKQLALWTIARMRWPLLADYLEEYPEYLNNFKQGIEDEKIHADVQDLLDEEDVQSVLNGEGEKIRIGIDKDALERFIQLKATAKSF